MQVVKNVAKVFINFFLKLIGGHFYHECMNNILYDEKPREKTTREQMESIELKMKILEQIKADRLKKKEKRKKEKKDKKKKKVKKEKKDKDRDRSRSRDKKESGKKKKSKKDVRSKKRSYSTSISSSEST